MEAEKFCVEQGGHLASVNSLKEQQEEKMKEEKEEEEEEEKSEININDPTSTLGPSRDPTDPSASGVTAEPIDPNRCLRPLQRARERRAARLKEESHADAEFDPDPHVPRAKLGSQRSSVLSAWEQERVYLRCDRCNNKLSDSDWSKFKSEGWDVETVKHLREVQRPLRLRCSPCAHRARAPTSSLT